MCYRFTEGLCQAGQNCKDAHSCKELRPGGTKPRLCPSYGKGACPRGESCLLAHSSKELWTGFKTKPCKAFKNNKCGSQSCPNAHGEEELQLYNKLMHEKLAEEAAAKAQTPPSQIPAVLAAAAMVASVGGQSVPLGQGSLPGSLLGTARMGMAPAPSIPMIKTAFANNLKAAVAKVGGPPKASALYGGAVAARITQQKSEEALGEALKALPTKAGAPKTLLIVPSPFGKGSGKGSGKGFGKAAPLAPTAPPASKRAMAGALSPEMIDAVALGVGSSPPEMMEMMDVVLPPGFELMSVAKSKAAVAAEAPLEMVDAVVPPARMEAMSVAKSKAARSPVVPAEMSDVVVPPAKMEAMSVAQSKAALSPVAPAEMSGVVFPEKKEMMSVAKSKSGAVPPAGPPSGVAVTPEVTLAPGSGLTPGPPPAAEFGVTAKGGAPAPGAAASGLLL